MIEAQAEVLLNYVGGEWTPSQSGAKAPVRNPATSETIALVPLSPAEEVDQAVAAAMKAYPEWRETPVVDRIKPLFKLRDLLTAHLDELARTITNEAGKTYGESLAEMQRGVENVEVACGAPILLQGYNNEDIARGIDEHMFRQPLGVVAAITPFNFPGMIPLWFMPYAVASGNCFLLKPSEKVPMTTQLLFRLFEEAGFPPGVVSLVNGGKETVDAILDHPDVKAVSFVGSTPVAKYIYSRAAASGKRAQCQGGAKNPAIVLPDADMEMSTRILADSAFGCAGQRCLATSAVITVGEARGEFTERIAEAAASRKVGYGLMDGVEMGPVISAESRERIRSLVDKGLQEGARAVVDGRDKEVDGFRDGYFVHPTVLDEVDPRSTIAATEVFGPVLALMHARDLDEAIQIVNDRRFGNQASIFTSSGAAARHFRHHAVAGNIGVNLGVAAPMAFFPFSGWGDSFFGDLHAQAHHGFEFYTQTKVVVERWPKQWSRTF
ncbi:MAG TPA: CoA-acylating methylmalonate-semialdehyde dehydrogenase [Trueperaceae bacterium]|nr:CoA-acylating methylmalonate-semialdehyde dehydrogenase [Trueperaceae bacterium]